MTSPLVAAWKVWDRVCAATPRHPPARYGEIEARRMEAECRRAAEAIGVGCSDFRARLAAARRSGLGYTAAVRQAVNG